MNFLSDAEKQIDDPREFLKKITMAKHLLVKEFYMEKLHTKPASAETRLKLFDLIVSALKGDNTSLWSEVWCDASW